MLCLRESRQFLFPGCVEVRRQPLGDLVAAILPAGRAPVKGKMRPRRTSLRSVGLSVVTTRVCSWESSAAPTRSERVRILPLLLHGPEAQSAEQPVVSRKVAGANPVRAADSPTLPSPSGHGTSLTWRHSQVRVLPGVFLGPWSNGKTPAWRFGDAGSTPAGSTVTTLWSRGKAAVCKTAERGFDSHQGFFSASHPEGRVARFLRAGSGDCTGSPALPARKMGTVGRFGGRCARALR